MSGEQSEERVTLWRWTVEQGDDGTDWQTSRPPVRPDLNDFEVREFVSPSPVDTEGHGLSEGGKSRAADSRDSLPHTPLSESDLRDDSGEGDYFEPSRRAKRRAESDHGLSGGAAGKRGVEPLDSPLAESDNEARWRSYDPEGFAKAHPAESDQLGSEGDTDFCPTCGSKVRSKTGGGYRLTQGGSCPDPWHSRSQAGEG